MVKDIITLDMIRNNNTVLVIAEYGTGRIELASEAIKRAGFIPYYCSICKTLITFEDFPENKNILQVYNNMGHLSEFDAIIKSLTDRHALIISDIKDTSLKWNLTIIQYMLEKTNPLVLVGSRCDYLPIMDRCEVVLLKDK